ncbi:MAG: hypothetical protein RIS94_2186 [Pseudomonadota bacterium]|jgi:long-chain acyl-CoA synthetase
MPRLIDTRPDLAAPRALPGRAAFPTDRTRRTVFHPRFHAATTPDRPACITAETGEVMTYAALEEAANRGAHLLRQLGLQRGDVLAVMLENEPAVFTIAWAAERTGLYLTSISTRLSLADADYIVGDCGAKALVVSDCLAAMGRAIAADRPGLPCFAVSEGYEGLPGWEGLNAACPATPIADESPGTDMLYSSGTTGRPKGVRPPLPTGALGMETPLVRMGRSLYGLGANSVYLSTSPLYHAAPLRWAMAVQRLGGTIVMMRKFDAETALGLIERHRITHGTWVPTHFVRLLRLPEEVRHRFDISSLCAAIHAGAPCPVGVKQQMIDWWGPVLHEYYSGTETCGITALDSREWLERPGSVGKAIIGTVHVTDDEGRVLPPGKTGAIWFADGPTFEYHNDPAKTAAAHNDRGWATLGDIGYLDADGYLYLTDRKNFMIISGGVNIYPQEIENLLATHPDVADVAVIGAPDDEMGQVVVAVVQATDDADRTRLAEDLRAFARQGLGSLKCPKRFEFRDALPREPTGKLLKGKLIAELGSAG